jgi:Na+/H+ antiporter NhaD/arsenite permease-like protein
MQLQFILLKEVVKAEIVLGLLILIAVYAIIILDLLHRTVAALLGSFLALGSPLAPSL